MDTHGQFSFHPASTWIARNYCFHPRTWPDCVHNRHQGSEEPASACENNDVINAVVKRIYIDGMLVDYHWLIVTEDNVIHPSPLLRCPIPHLRGVNLVLLARVAKLVLQAVPARMAHTRIALAPTTSITRHTNVVLAPSAPDGQPLEGHIRLGPVRLHPVHFPIPWVDGHDVVAIRAPCDGNPVALREGIRFLSLHCKSSRQRPRIQFGAKGNAV
mmetsp:Transcript_31850/g.95339  ORF Transcript_31850/g.95339 Transcript_31850/m.95339 type:complete len:215 (+) Transcript_31850:121-765(+)